MAQDVFLHTYLNRDQLVHILDADAPTCEALSILLRLEGFQTQFSLEVTTFRAKLSLRLPDMVILNALSSSGGGLDTLKSLKETHPALPVLVISERDDTALAVSAMRCGAADVLAKPINSEYMINVVRDTLRLDPQISVMRSTRRTGEIRGFEQLTARDREVLHLITDGQSNKQTGRELGISPRTVEVHRARVMEKLSAKNTADWMRIILVG